MDWLLVFIICGSLINFLFYIVDQREKQERKTGKCSRKITDLLIIAAMIVGVIGISPIIYFVWYFFGGAVLIEGFDSFDTSEIIGSFIGSTICFIIVIIFIVALFSRK